MLRYIFGFFLLVAISGCKTRHTELGGISQSQGYIDDGTAVTFKLTQDNASLGAGVNAILLDEADFRINGVRVGLINLLSNNMPVLTFIFPSSAQFIQISRCPKASLIYGGSDFLNTVELGAPNLETETAKFRSNEFWATIQKTQDCKVITSNLTDSYFYDMGAGTGQYIYYLRACVSPNFLLNNNKINSSGCSREVMSSNSIDFINSRQNQQLDQLQKLATALDTVDDKLLQTHNFAKMVIIPKSFACQNRLHRPILTQDQGKTMLNIAVPSTALTTPSSDLNAPATTLSQSIITTFSTPLQVSDSPQCTQDAKSKSEASLLAEALLNNNNCACADLLQAQAVFIQIANDLSQLAQTIQQEINVTK